MSDETPKFDVATVGELEQLLRRLKREKRITSKTRLMAPDVDGCTNGKGPCEIRVFSADPRTDYPETLAVWGPFGD